MCIRDSGSTEGIITLHDLTESIFGDILEEDETEEEEIVTRQDLSLIHIFIHGRAIN